MSKAPSIFDQTFGGPRAPLPIPLPAAAAPAFGLPSAFFGDLLLAALILY